MNLSSNSATPVFEKTENIQRQDFATLNGRMAWIQTDLGRPDKSPQLFISNGNMRNSRAVENLVGSFQDLQWFEGSRPGEEKLLMTRKPIDQPLSQTVIYDPQKNCLKVLLASDKFNISQARLAGGRKRIAFASNQIGGKFQIFSKWIQESELDCEAKP